MDMDDCGHFTIENEICTTCGKCLGDTTLVDDAFTHVSYNSSTQIMKYTVKNQFKNYDASLIKILTALQLLNYKPMLKELLNSLTFKTRLSKEDKIIVVLYHVLQQEGFPITIADLLKYSNMDKYKLLKAHRDTFGFVSTPQSYLEAIYMRFSAFIKSYGINSNLSFSSFLKYKKFYVSASPNELCIACFLVHADSDVSLKHLQLKSKNYNEKIRKLVKKLRIDFHFDKATVNK